MNSKMEEITGSHASPLTIDGLLSQPAVLLPRRIEFHKAIRRDLYEENLKKKFIPINKPSSASPQTATNGVKAVSNGKKEVTPEEEEEQKADENEFRTARQQLFPESEVQALLKWKQVKKIGAGLQNLGNTCFLNSILQCLTYTPPLANYVMQREHTKQCRTPGFCVFCALERHIDQAINATGSVISPRNIVANLKSISKLFRLGRQEDSHEFLRYLIDGLQKSCLQGLEKKLDPKIQETTIVHRIFGGYLQSQVKCSLCGFKSNTFDPFLDLSLEIKGCDSVQKAFQKFTSPEVLDKQNKYKCPNCNKKSQATKQFSIRKAPNVLTLQLKRFDFSGWFGGKINKPVAFPERLDLTPYLSRDERDHPIYSLYGVLVHFGHSANSGHYFSFIKSTSGLWHCMDDSNVKQVSLSSVLSQKAYMLFYVRDSMRANIAPARNTLFANQALSASSIATTNPQPSANCNKKRKADSSPTLENGNGAAMNGANKRHKPNEPPQIANGISSSTLQTVSTPSLLASQENGNHSPQTQKKELPTANGVLTASKVHTQRPQPTAPKGKPHIVIWDEKSTYQKVEEVPEKAKVLTVVKELTSFETTLLGTEVEHWNNVAHSEVENQKRLLQDAALRPESQAPDEWNLEYDKGKTKKTKLKRSLFEDPPQSNPFQEFYSTKKQKIDQTKAPKKHRHSIKQPRSFQKGLHRFSKQGRRAQRFHKRK